MATGMERVLAEIGAILDRLGVRYAVGGSVASSLYGEPRATNDIDLGLDLKLSDIRPLLKALTPGWFVEPGAVERATANNDMFQVLHEAELFKVDLYVAELHNPLDRLGLERRRRIDLADGSPVWFASPEDVILRKLDWERLSGGVLTNQRRDVQGILRWQAGKLDLVTLRKEARSLGLAEALESCLRTAGLEPGT